MTRKPLAILLLVASCLFLSGCITLQVDTKINSDGSGTNTIICGLAKDALGEYGWLDIWADFKREAYQAGAQVEDWTDGQYEGLKIVYRFSTLDELQTQINSSQLVADYLQDFSVRQEGDLYIYDASFDLGEQMFPVRGLKFYFALETPGKIVSYSPQEFAKAGSNRVVWQPDVALVPAFQLHAEGKAKAGLDRYAMPVIIGVVAALLLAGLVWLVVSLLKKRGSPPPSAVSPEDQDYAPDTFGGTDSWGGGGADPGAAGLAGSPFDAGANPGEGDTGDLS